MNMADFGSELGLEEFRPEARAWLEAALSGRFDAAKGPDVGEAQA